MAGDVRICVRFRGGQPKVPAPWKFPDQETLFLPPCPPDSPVHWKDGHQHTFHRVFQSGSTQKDVFEEVCRPTVDEVVNGFHATIFCYGQTGTGKTFSMFGTREHPGMFPQAAAYLIARLEDKKLKEAISYDLKASFVETIAKNFVDLIEEEKEDSKRAKVATMKSNPASMHKVTSVEQMTNMLEDGLKRRTVAATKMNADSSRTHGIFTVEVAQFKLGKGKKNRVLATLNFVDLAGSERVKKSGVTGVHLYEAARINSDLTFLNNVVRVLVERKSAAIRPDYRNCNLTKFLQESLGGNSKTTFLMTLSPELSDLEETFQTIEFAQRAIKLPNKATFQEVAVGGLSDQELAQWNTLEAENKDLRKEVMAAHAQARREIEKAEEERRAAMERAHLAEEQRKEMETALASLREMHQAERNRINTLISAKPTDSSGLEELNAKLSQALKEEEAKRFEAEVEVSRLKGVANTLQKELEQVRQDKGKVADERHQEIARLEEADDRFRQELADKQQIISDLVGYIQDNVCSIMDTARHHIITEMLIDVTLTTARKFPYSATVQTSVWSVMRRVMTNATGTEMETTDRKLMTPDGIGMLLEVMKRHMYVEELQIITCTVLAQLALDPEYQENLRKFDAASLLISIMEVHARHPAVLESVCRALANLCQDYTNVSAMAEAKVVDRLCEVIRRFPGNPDVVQQACLAIAHLLLDPSIQRALYERRGVALLTDVMKTHKMNQDVLTEVCRAFTAASLDSDIQQSIGKEQVIPALLDIISLHKTNAILQRQACRALGQIAWNHDGNQRAIVAAKGLPLVMDVLRECKDDELVPECVAYCINYLLPVEGGVPVKEVLQEDVKAILRPTVDVLLSSFDKFARLAKMLE